MRTLGKAFLGLLLKHKGEKTSTYFPLLKRGNTEAGRQVGQEVWLRWPAQPLGGAAGRDVPRTYFCSLHLSSGSWCVAFLYPVVHGCTRRTCVQLYLAPIVAYILLLQDHLSLCGRSGKESQVPACLTGNSTAGLSPLEPLFYIIAPHTAKAKLSH